MTSALLEALVRASVQASVFVVMLLVARRALGSMLPAGVCCLGWTLVALRLVLPISLFSPFGAPAMNLDAIAGLGASVAAVSEALPAAPRAMAGSGSPLVPVLVAAWIAGMVLTAWILLRPSWNIRRRLRRAATLAHPEITAAWADVADPRSLRRVRLVTLAECRSPFVIGSFAPTLVIPTALVGELEPDAWRQIFRHELAHLQRKDLWRGALWTAAVILHWPNPLVWLALRAWAADRELAADAHAVTLGGEARGLAAALLDVVEHGSRSPVLPVSSVAASRSTTAELSRRISVLLRHTSGRGRGRGRGRTGATSVAVLLAAAMTFTSPRSAFGQVVVNAGLEHAGTSATPEGWFLSGWNRADYRVELDPDRPHSGRTSARLQAGPTGPGVYGTLMQQVPVAAYHGRRIRVSAFVRGANIAARGDFWARVQAVDSPADGSGLGGGRCALVGTFDWRRCDIELEVPSEGDHLDIGLGLGLGPGIAWVDDVEITVLR